VAVRCNSLSLSASGNTYLEPGQWQGSINYRWLHSDRHFRGDDEEPHRKNEGSEVINDVHTFDVTATYQATHRVSLALTLPFVHAWRSSLYEHQDSRHATEAGGLGDVRLMASAWVFDPREAKNGNLAFGIGVKAPTGDYQATDYFYRADGSTVLRPVDQSIQPGDGGWGILVDVQAFQRIYKGLFGYVNGTYLFNPRGVNGTETPNSRPGNVTIMSVPDAYLGRAGLSYAIWPSKGLTFSLGGRVEGVPVYDWLGSSGGFRRPGYALSVEPGLSWAHGRHLLTFSMPWAIDRNRERSAREIDLGREGGDAAFADFLVLAGYNLKF
jgi:hypothetical protein